MKKFFLITALLLLFASTSEAQIYEYPLKVTICGGNVYTYSKSSNGLFEICKYGDNNWVYYHLEPGFDDAIIYDLVEGDGDVYAIGKIKENTDYKTILIRINNNGAKAWVKYLDYNSNDDAGLSIAYDRGDLYFTGFATDGSQKTEALVNKFTKKGHENWNRPLLYNINPGYSNDIGSKILVDSNYVYIGGTTVVENSITTDIFMMTLSKDGFVTDEPQVYEIPYANEYLTDFIFLTNHTGGGTTILKNMVSTTIVVDNIRNGTKDYGVLVFEGGIGSGLLWPKIYRGGNMDEVAAKVMLSSDSNVIVTGYAQKSLYDYDFATMKHNKLTGAPMWTDSIIYYPEYLPSTGKTNTIDMASALAKKSNEIYVGGFSESAGNQFVIQTIVDNEVYNGIPLNISYSPNFISDYMPDQYKMKAFLGVDQTTGNIISVFAKANIYNDADIDYAIVKYDSTGNVLSETEVMNEQPENLNNQNSNNLRVYPNPFNPETNIEFNLQAGSLVNIKIYDISGREIFKLNEKRPSGLNKVNFNASNLPSGVYFLKIQTDNFSEIKRLMLLK